MKNKTWFLALLIANLTLTVGAQTVVKIINAPAPSPRSPNYNQWLTNFMVYLETGTAPATSRTNDPSALELTPWLDWYDLVETTNAPLWLGTFNPIHPSLSGERGNTTLFGVIIKSPAGVRLADVRATLKSSDPYNSLNRTKRFNTVNYSFKAVGLVWRDGVEGRPGATRIVSGSATQVVNQIFLAGLASGYMAESQTDLDNVRGFILNDPPQPFTITARYDLLNEVDQPTATAVKRWPVASQTPFGVRLVANMTATNFVAVTVIGSTNESYTVLTATNILGPWTDYATLFNPLNGINIFTVQKNEPLRFFK